MSLTTTSQSDIPVTNRLQPLKLLIFLAFGAVILAPDLPAADSLQDRQVPLLDDAVMIRVPVNAFGKTLYFLLDTGFSISAIDARYASQLGEATGTCHAASPLKTNSVLPVFHCPEMSIAGSSLGLKEITSLDLKMARLVSGQSCDGILGMDFFMQHVVSLDFDQRVVHLSDRVPKKIAATFVSVPLRPSSRNYTAEVVVNHTQTLDLLIDSGDNSSLSLDTGDWQKVFATEKTNEFVVSVADVGNQVVQSKIGVVEHLAIGGLAYTNLHATLIQNPDTLSHLGLGFFRRHQVTFDFANRRLYLEPGREFTQADQEDMSGLHLLRDGGATIVYSVDENSPAFARGIRPHDLVESVDGQSTASLALREIRRKLQSRDGDRVVLQIKRGGDLLNFEFNLKNAI